MIIETIYWRGSDWLEDFNDVVKTFPSLGPLSGRRPSYEVRARTLPPDRCATQLNESKKRLSKTLLITIENW